MSRDGGAASKDPAQDDDLRESRLSTFIDGPREHALYFLEGQRLIRDLALVQMHPGRGFELFREIVLTAQPLIALIKGREQLGFYVDSQDPLFRFKLESTHGGDTRSILVPDDFGDFPATLTGLVRVETRYASGRQPYQSVVEAPGIPWREVVGRVLRDSYQVKAALRVSDVADQSVMLHRLPLLKNEDDSDYTMAAVQERLEGMRSDLDAIFARALQDPDALRDAFSELGFRRISSRPVRFHCGCSHERTVAALRLIDDPSQLFDPGQETLEATCDYCRTAYIVSRQELLGPPDVVH